MDPVLTFTGSVAALLVSILGAVGTFWKVLADRKAGIRDSDLNSGRLQLDALNAALQARDALLEDYREEVARLKAEVLTLRAELDDLYSQR